MNKIKPHKGGRTARLDARVTDKEKLLIMQKCKDLQMSFSDWCVYNAKKQPARKENNE